MYEIDRGFARANVTAAFAFSTSEKMCPPVLIYPLERVTPEITHKEFLMTAA